MIDYQTYCRIRDAHDQQGLNISQIAQALELNEKTVSKWLVDLFQQECAQLHPVPAVPYDVGTVHSVRASSRFRVTHETNRYSVPAEYAGRHLILKVYPDRLCIYHEATLIARHTRCYERHQDIEDPDHPTALLAQRRIPLARFPVIKTPRGLSVELVEVDQPAAEIVFLNPNKSTEGV